MKKESHKTTKRGRLPTVKHIRKRKVKIKLKQDKGFHKPYLWNLFNKLLTEMGNWVKITKKSGKFVRGVITEIDTIHRCVYLHALRPIKVKFKHIKHIQYISVACHLPKFYRRRLRKLGINLKPKKIVRKEGQMKFEKGVKTWPKNL